MSVLGALVRVDLAQVEARVREVLPRFPEVAAAYLFGSALGPCRPDSDIDLGLVLDPAVPEPPGWGFAGLEADVETQLGRVDGHPFDVTVLSPRQVLFSFPTVREGRLVYTRDRDLLTDFLERVARPYADLRRRYERALAEVLDR